MKKIAIFFVFFTFTILNAGLINGIAVIVNDKPITMNELQAKMEEFKISKEIAIGLLVEEKLYEEELNKLGIGATPYEVDEHIKEIALSNNIDLASFKRLVESQYGSYEAYANDVKQKLIHSKLVSAISRGNLSIATKEDLKFYYENNIQKFTLANNIEVMEYASLDQELLEQPRGSLKNDERVNKRDINFDMQTVSAELRYILMGIQEGEISSVLNANNQYVRLEVIKKHNPKVMPFENVEEAIFQEIMQKREQNYLKEYFDKLKISAEILVLR